MQRGNIALNRAVGLDSDKAALRAETLSLGSDDVQVLRIELRNDHWHIRRKAVCGVVGNDRALCLCICFLKCSERILLHINSAEAEIDLRSDLLNILACIIDHEICKLLRHRLILECPAGTDCLTVGLSGRAGRCCHDRDLEPRMICKQQCKALTDHAGRTDDSNAKFFH